MTPNIGILALGAANGKSVACALERAGAYAFFIDRASDLRAIDGLVIPGVANFGYVADSLDRLALRDPVRTALEDGLPALGICVGFQILFEGSEEAPNAKGLGCFPGRLGRVCGPKSPHMGWNTVQTNGDSGLVRSGWAYFAHAYAPQSDAQGTIAHTVYDSATFASASQTLRTTGVQFHPERSGAYGAALLSRFVGSAKCSYAG